MHTLMNFECLKFHLLVLQGIHESNFINSPFSLFLLPEIAFILQTWKRIWIDLSFCHELYRKCQTRFP